MAYDITIPAASNNWEDDLSAMLANFTWLRSQFLTGVIPIDGASIEYAYTGDLVTTVTIKDSASATIASCAYTYDASDQLTDEDWTVGSKTYALTYTWSSGKLTKTEIDIT